MSRRICYSWPTQEGAFSVAFGALYLAGAPRSVAPSPKKWPMIEHLFRRYGAEPDALEHAGLYKEALVLADEALMEWAANRLSQSSYITVFSPNYPCSWLSKLCSNAPPALWVRGSLATLSYIALAGSRSPSADAKSFAKVCGETLAESGLGFCSGGAAGCDTIGLEAYLRAGGSRAAVLLPRGLSPSDAAAGVSYLSLEAPGAPFRPLAALSRNALIYALSDAAVAVQPRFREGGTWHGAYAALRSSLCPVLVMAEPSNFACTALQSLGASALSMDCACSLPSFLQAVYAEGPQPALFSAAG